MRRHTPSSPSIVRLPLPEDEAQALDHLAATLGVNEDPAIEPGQLNGMSRVLEHAAKTWDEMRAQRSGGPEIEDTQGAGYFSPVPIFLEQDKLH